MRIAKKNSELKVKRTGQTLLVALCLLSLFVFQVGLGNAFSGQGAELRALEQRKQQLLEENEKLRADAAFLGSLERIRQEAEDTLRMKDGGNRIDYLVPPKLAWR